MTTHDGPTVVHDRKETSMTAGALRGTVRKTVTGTTYPDLSVGSVVWHESADGLRGDWYVVTSVTPVGGQLHVSLLRERDWEQRRAGGES